MKVRLWFALSLCVTGLTWVYNTRVVGPWEKDRDARDGIKAQMGDLYPRWIGARELLINHRNPYGPEVSHEIQQAFYGHPVDPNRESLDEQRFAYPAYTVFLLAPTIYMNFEQVRLLARLLFGVLTATCVLFCVDMLHMRLPWEKLAAVILFTLSAPQIVQGLRLEQLALVVGFLLIAGIWCSSKHHLVVAGAVLAFSTIKPQMVLLPLCAFLIWVVGNWRKRWPLAISFLITVGLLAGAGEILIPGWFGYFVTGLVAYRRYNPAFSLLQLVLGHTFGEIVGGAAVTGLMFWAWQNRREPIDSPKFINVFSGFLVGAVLAFPLFTPFNQVLLILPVSLVLLEWKILSRFSRIAFVAAVSWAWIASGALILCPPHLNSHNYLLQRLSYLVSFFPLFLLLVLLSRGSPSRFRTEGTTPTTVSVE